MFPNISFCENVSGGSSNQSITTQLRRNFKINILHEAKFSNLEESLPFHFDMKYLSNENQG